MMHSKYKLVSFLAGLLLCCDALVSKAQTPPFYIVTPFDVEGYFTKTVFSFNPAFIKEKKVKGIALKDAAGITKGYFYDFDPDGLITGATVIHYKEGKADTAFYTRYYYNATRLVDKKATINYHNGIVDISCYQYDRKNRIDIIRTLVLNAKMPNRPQNNDWEGVPVPGVDKTILQGGLPDENLLHKMIDENKFSSWRYRHYTRDKFEVEERTEYFDFMKQSGNPDTCAQKMTYYYLNGLPVALFLHTGCAGKTTPSELYEYKEELLSALNAPAGPEPKSEKYSYDKSRNLVLMEDIWNGEKVSELVMTYDKKGFLVAIQRKSTGARAIHYFEDRNALKLTYTFY